MIKHYLKSTLRFLNRNRLYTGINALGLSISLAVSFLILLFVINERSYNHCHLKWKQVYRVIKYHKEYNNTYAKTPYPLAITLKEEYPQVIKAVNTRYLRGFRLKSGDEFINVNQAMASTSDIFDIFTLPFLGSTLYEDPIKDMNSLVLSKKLADQFFPDENPLGKEMDGWINDSTQVFIVTGVFEDLPRNSTLQVSCLVNSRWTLEPLNKAFNVTDIDVNFGFNYWNTYIRVAENTDVEVLGGQFSEFEKKYISEEPNVHYSLQNLGDVYLKSSDIANTGIQGNLDNIRLYSLVAFLIVLIAAINYIILSTAVSTGRAREIGIRKTAGGSIMRIRNQMWSEAVVLALMVLPISVLLMWLTVPSAERLFHTSLEIVPANIWRYILFFVLVTLLIGMASGMYTSAYLSRLKVLDVMKQRISFGRKRAIFRAMLISLQLVIFCSFVSSTLVIRSQYLYALRKDPGHYNKNILQLKLGGEFDSYQFLLDGIRSIPEVIMASGTVMGLPMLASMSIMLPHFQDKEKMVKVEGYTFDYGLLETMGITLLEGRAFSREYGDDLANSIILNETAVRELGIENPLGETLLNRTIISVVKDFNLHSIHTEIPPLYLLINETYLNYILVHYNPGTLSVVVSKLKSEWDNTGTDRPFRFSTIEDLFKDAYDSEKKLSTIISLAAIFAMVIAALGLFGLTLFVARSRTYEIGIKKVFGCTENEIVYSFLRGNFILVVISVVMSIPVTVWLMTRWLNNYPYRTSISWWVFLVSLVMAAIIVLVTVYVVSRRASRINPKDILRYE